MVALKKRKKATKASFSKTGNLFLSLSKSCVHQSHPQPGDDLKQMDNENADQVI